MANSYLDIIASLTAIMTEETMRLQSPGRPGDLAELADAKIKLVGALEAEAAQRVRTGDDWLATLDADARTQVTAAVQQLGEVAAINARVLERQIDLSTEMMDAVAAEARRLTGARSAVYGARGVVRRADTAAPISVNARL